jgi:hypothetical protein
MRKMMITLLIAAAITIGGCGERGGVEQASRLSRQAAEGEGQAMLTSPSSASNAIGNPDAQSDAVLQKVSLNNVSAAQAPAQINERKIIRNAEMTIEIRDPNNGLRKIAAIAEKNGGFVVTSESRENQAESAPSTTVAVVARVPAAKFGEAVREIQSIDGRILREKISGTDVTEEYIDLEARIRTKRALEEQFLEIMRQARKVSDALEVQTQLADVRTEIERLEGRRRFLENQSALSTISITLQTPAPLLMTTSRGFWHSVKMAFGDGLETASEIVLGIIRFVIVLIPMTVLIVLPCWFLFRWLRRYASWPKRSAPAISVTDHIE